MPEQALTVKGRPGLGELLSRARYGTYFEILGLGADCEATEVARRAEALLALVDELSGTVVMQETAGAEGRRMDAGLLASEQDEIRWAISEACRVLCDRSLRNRYSLGLQAARNRQGGE